MKTHLLLILILILCTSVCFAQTSFKQGYFIDLEGNKTECFIKDQDWKGSPKSFNYKATESGSVEKMDTEKISEFKAGTTKYVRAKVQYDQSSQEIAKLGINNNPEWIDGNLLLKVIVDGKASLYQYNEKNLLLFFYSVSGSPVEQLVFKSYYTDPGKNQKLLEQKQYLHTNSTYVYQLNSKVKCGDNANATSKEVPYELKSLTQYFVKYNRCSGDVVTETSKPKKQFSMRLTPGYEVASAKADVIDIKKYNYSSEKSFRMGLDLQFLLPFNNGKWAIVAEPTYATYSGEDVKQKGKLDMQLIEVPFGVRHRFFLSDNSYIFLNAMVLMDFPMKLTRTIPITANSSATEVSSKGTAGFTAGAGFSYGRFSIEGRYYPQRNRNTGEVVYSYTKSTVILGFRVF